MLEITKDNFINHEKLDKHEAIHFISFLEEEKRRHMMAITVCDTNRYVFRHIPVLELAYQTSVIRHMEDIRLINSTINYLKQKFNITEKDYGI